MISIKKSHTADTRTCDVSKVTKEVLLQSSFQHKDDVKAAMTFFSTMLMDAAAKHDHTKISHIDEFHSDFKTGFKVTKWWDMHRAVERHHIGQADGVKGDVDLVDVIEYIADCVMAGMGRSGSVYPLHLQPELLEKAFQNTVEKLKAEVVVEG